MLLGILAHTPPSQCTPAVFSLLGEGPLAGAVRDLGIPLHGIGMRRGIPDPAAVARLASALRQFRPNVVQTWMYHADLIGGLAARLAGVRHIAWSIHSSDLDPRRVKRSTLWTVRLCARLSRSVPEKICATARRAITVHQAIGYDGAKFIHIPNGFDTVNCRPNPEAREAVRAELGVAPEDVLIGMVARFDPQKDHRNFARAAGILRKICSTCRFLLCGPEVTEDNAELVGWLEEAGVRDRTYLLGSRSDIPHLLPALDIGCLSSAYGETFPLAIGETMAAGVPCVVTDVGDAPDLVGETGRVAPPEDSEALAAAWAELVERGPSGRAALGAAARARVVADFDIRHIATRYADLHQSLMDGASR